MQFLTFDRCDAAGKVALFHNAVTYGDDFLEHYGVRLQIDVQPSLLVHDDFLFGKSVGNENEGASAFDVKAEITVQVGGCTYGSSLYHHGSARKGR